ncbi:hypothetical protein [Collimonas antrihumi]|uniref:hypothetical protein n=1 Tax=Collimonas antrihumi TaxID=1940615 RepID=UPI001B8AD5EC|nr:hypothetical protein [Collimonas antrihumi]
MNYRTAHRSGANKFQSHGSMAGKNASHPRRTARLFRLIGCTLFVLAGLGGLALAVQQSATALEQAQNSEQYPSYRGNVWAMLQLHGR